MRKILIVGIIAFAMMASAGLVSADTVTHVTWDSTNPHIMISSHAQLKAGYSTLRATSVFTLIGNGDAIGDITASTGTYHCCRTLPKASLSGGYTASNGDFQSMFESSDLTQVSTLGRRC